MIECWYFIVLRDGGRWRVEGTTHTLWSIVPWTEGQYTCRMLVKNSRIPHYMYMYNNMVHMYMYTEISIENNVIEVSDSHNNVFWYSSWLFWSSIFFIVVQLSIYMYGYVYMTLYMGKEIFIIFFVADDSQHANTCWTCTWGNMTIGSLILGIHM